MSKRKIIIIAGVVLAVLLVVGGAAAAVSSGKVISISVGGAAAAEPAAAPAAPVAHAAPAAAAPSEGLASMTGIPIDIGAKVVNLADPGGYRYLRVAITLEVEPPSKAYYTLEGEEKTKEEQVIKDQIVVLRAPIDDAIVTLLSNKTFGDIFTLSGKEDLKAELLQIINERTDPVHISRIYFTDFIIQ